MTRRIATVPVGTPTTSPEISAAQTGPCADGTGGVIARGPVSFEERIEEIVDAYLAGGFSYAQCAERLRALSDEAHVKKPCGCSSDWTDRDHPRFTVCCEHLASFYAHG